MPSHFKKIIPHFLVIVGFVIVSLAYFSPVLQGKMLFQSDIAQHTGMAKQQEDYRAKTLKETYWTNSAFGGMPTYQLGAKYPHDYIKMIDLAIRILPRPADYLLLYFIGFYVLLLVLKVDFKLAVLGALAFGFSTYLIIIIGVGHNSKAHAIAYMPLVLSGILLVFQKRYLIGFLLTVLSLGLQIRANHYQMTYYLIWLVLLLGVVYLIDTLKKKEWRHFLKSTALLIAAAFLSIGLNATGIMATQEYVKESTRGKNALTLTPGGLPKETTTGLDKTYITEYSYGFLETFNLFIPRFIGGGSSENVGKNSEMYRFFRSLGASPAEALEQVKHTPTYWGEQPFVKAPAYIGAVVIFLFVLALFLIKGTYKWWLVAGTIFSLLLSYGKNLEFLTHFFIDYVPLYNKFRAVSSIQVLLELCVPVLAILGLSRLFDPKTDQKEALKALKQTTLITAGLALVFLLFKSSLFNFVGHSDGAIRQAYGQEFIEALKADRIMIFTKDTIRTLVLVLLSAAVLWAFINQKIKSTIVVLGLGVLIVFDLVGVNKRYVSNTDFVYPSQVKQPFTPTKADKQVLKDTSNFRVLDVTTNPFNSARASYFHNAFGGYHAAKPKRAQDIFEYQIAKNNLEVLNMLNIKYIFQSDNNRQEAIATTNEDANGNAWFINDLKVVDTADEEMQALDSLNTKKEAVILNPKLSKLNFVTDSLSQIGVSQYQPNYIKYNSSNSHDGFAVFSESYYGEGWNAYIDGDLEPHFRVNYLLRGLEIPNGKHTIEFKFEPKVVQTGSTIALLSAVFFGALVIGGLVICYKSSSSKV